MSIFWKTGVMLLLLGFGCEEKRVSQTSAECNTTVQPPTAQEVKTDGKAEEPKIELASIDLPKSSETDSEPKAEPEKKPAMAMNARVVPEPVKYNTEDITREIFDNKASREEAKDDDLRKIKEGALRRLKEKEKTASLPMHESEVDHDAAPAAAPAVDRKKGEALFVKARIQANKGRQQAASDLYLASCQAGYAEGCHKFAWHQEQAGNRANAFQFYRTACEHGLGKSCNNLAFYFEREKNLDKALDFYATACMKKHEPSCTNLKRLRDEMKAR